MLVTLKVPEELYLEAVHWLSEKTERRTDAVSRATMGALAATNAQLSGMLDELQAQLDTEQRDNWALREQNKLDAATPAPNQVREENLRARAEGAQLEAELLAQELVRMGRPRIEVEEIRLAAYGRLDTDESYPDHGVDDDRAAAMGEPALTTGTPAELGQPELAETVRQEAIAQAAADQARHEAPEPPVDEPAATPEGEGPAEPEHGAHEAPAPKPTAAKPSAENADLVAWASQFVKDRVAVSPGVLTLASELPAAYAAWAADEPDAPPTINARWIGSAMKRAGYVGKLRHSPELKKSAQTYIGVEILTPAQRRQREADNIRAAADAAKKAQPAVEVNRDEAKLDPYITPRVVAQEKPGIVHVKTPKPPTRREQSGVTVVRADGKVTTVQEYETQDEAYREPIKPEDADGLTFDIYTDCQTGTNRPYSVADDVLALYGVDTDAIEAAIRNPQRVTIRPESKEKGYPVLSFHRGDLDVIAGFRTPDRPKVMAAYVFSALGADTHRVNHTGGGGKKGTPGLPTTVKMSVRALKQKGLEIPDTWESATAPVEVSYQGKVLGKMKVHLADKSQVQGDYQRLLRQAHAIDRRKEMAGAAS